MSLPLYLTEPDQSGYTYGKLIHSPGRESWIIEAEPAVLEMAKRVFTGCRSFGEGRIRFPDTKRAAGDLNWLMLKFPLIVESKDQFKLAREKAITHALRRDRLIVLPPTTPPPTFTGTLLPFQADGVSFLVANERALLADDMGLGKAQPLDAKILTPTGWKRMGDVQVGDIVIGSDGGPTTVTGVFPQGDRAIFKVTFTDGSSTECDEQHLWAVRTPNQRVRQSHYRVKNLSEIMVHGLVDKQGNRQHFIPMVQPVTFQEQDTPLDPYMVGVILGDGGLTQHSVNLSAPDEEILMAVGQALPSSVSAKLQPNTTIDYRLKTDVHGSNALITALRALKLMGKGSHEKFVPDLYKFNSVSTRHAILQGLLDTDAYVEPDGNCIEYVTTSPRLAEDVKFLVQSLGGKVLPHLKIPFHTYKGERRQGKLAYRLMVALPPDILPFRLSRKADSYTPRQKYLPYRAIARIDYAGIKPAQCIRVDASDHLYVTDEFILTHNTVQGLASLATAGTFPALLVTPANVQMQWRTMAGKFLDLPTNGQQAFDLDAEDRGKRMCHIIKGRTPYALPSVPIYIIHYGLIADWYKALSELDLKAIVFDEIQELRHTGTQKYTGASDLSAGVRYVWGLSGTPIYNYGGEIWSVTNILDYHALGDEESFTKEWCTGYGVKVVAKPDLLGHYLKREGLMIRRTKAQVQSELPPKRRVVHLVNHDEHRYNALITQAVRLAKGYSDIKEWHEKGQTKRLIENETRQATGIAKAPYVASFVRTLLEAGERVLLYAYHHAVHDILTEELREFKPVKISGKESQTEKNAAVDSFEKGQTNLVQLSLRSTAGLDRLQGRGSCVVFAELDWSPAVLSQCEDRLHRIGIDKSLESILCYYLVTNTGMDETMQGALGLKVGQFVGIMGDQAATEEDKVLSEQAAERHMDRVIEKLKQMKG